MFTSTGPFHFDIASKVGHIASHALEVVRDTDGSWWVTSAGWGQGGVYLAPLYWSERVTHTGLRVMAPSYRLDVQEQPTAAITSLSAPVGGTWRELLSSNFRPPDSTMSWQPLWAPGGTSWPPGTYPGGTWRIGVSPHPQDAAYADSLSAGLNTS